MKTKSKSKPAGDADGDITAAYDAFKEFEGQRYTGMRIGRSHRWHYDRGEWKETKVTPERWEISYAVTKRRHGKAPEGSGVPVGTSYHWYIVAHQNVTKLNANDYSTSMTGMKFKLAHKRADTGKWSASTRAQRKHLIKIMQSVIQDLEKQGTVDETRAPEKARVPEKNVAAKHAVAEAKGKQTTAETKKRVTVKPVRRVAAKRVARPKSRRVANGRYKRAG